MLTDQEIQAQVLEAFREEQAEHRQAIGEMLLELERSPDHPGRRTMLDQLFREAHSLKGGARAAAQLEVEQVAHLLEDLLSAVRQDRLAITPAICDPIYEALDVIGALMRQAEAGHPCDLAPHQPLLATLTHIRDQHAGMPALVVHHGHAPPSRTAPQTSAPPADTAEPQVPQARTADPDAQSTVRLPIAALDHMLNETGELLTCAVSARQRLRDMHGMSQLSARWRRTWRQLTPSLTRLQTRAPAIQPVVHYLSDPAALESPSVTEAAADHETARLLAALAQANDLIGEMEARIATHLRETAEDCNRLSAATDRLHRQIRQTRMQPLTTLFTPLRLQVREIARATGKQVELALEDGGAEADRQVLDRLREVLLHLLRNAIDHGVEPAEARAAAGKPVAGLVALRAEVGGEYLTLTISDDGSGLDRELIRQRALSHGLISAGELARLSDADLVDLIFTPGFTTSQTISALSGRGVGLDVVRTQVERMHGHVRVQSAPGAGCTFTVTVPLSLTTSHCLLIRVDPVVYALPLDTVQRIVGVRPHDIQSLEGRAALVLDGRPIPIIHLADVLSSQPAPERVGAHALALLLGSGERQVACLVDGVLGDQELIMQRLPAPLQRVRLIAGATLLANGSVVPILDAVDLLRAALGTQRTVAPADVARAEQRRTVLVADDSITTRTLEKNILEAAGYQVRLATDGVEALQLLDALADEGGCDLLLSDVDMPRLNGFDLTRAVRSDTRFQHLPIVLVTSLDTPADRERGIASGADSYIVKRAFDQQALLGTIARLIA